MWLILVMRKRKKVCNRSQFGVTRVQRSWVACNAIFSEQNQPATLQYQFLVEELTYNYFTNIFLLKLSYFLHSHV